MHHPAKSPAKSVSINARTNGKSYLMFPKTVAFILFVLVGIIIIYSASSGRAQNGGTFSADPSATPAPRKDMPDYVKFSFIFHHLENVKERSGPLSRYKEKMGLSDEDFAQVADLAAQHEREVGALDNQAQAIIAEFHRQYPPGQLKGVKLPPPPAELKELQNQRDATSLRYGERIRTQLGEEKYKHFQEFLDREFPKKNTEANTDTQEVQK